LTRTFEWESQQPGGREKHATAAAVLKSYNTWLGEKAYVQKGVDVRGRYKFIEYGFIGADLDNFEAAFGMMLVRAMFEASVRGHSRQPRLFIFIPEGQLLFDRTLEYARRGRVSFLARFFPIANSLSVGLIVAAQAGSRLSLYVLANCPTVVVLRQDSQQEARFCAQTLGLGEESVPVLMALPLGVAMVKAAGWDAPCLVRLDFINPGPPLTSAQVEERFADDYQQMRKETTYARRDEIVEVIDWQNLPQAEKHDGQTSHQYKRTSSKPKPQLLEEHYQFLLDIQQHPGEGLKARYDRLAWGVERGNRVLRGLNAAGCVQIKRVRNPSRAGGGDLLVASLTPEGQFCLEAYDSRKSRT